MNLSRPFIRRPVGTALLALAVLLAGATGYRQLPVAPLPQVDVPTLSVTGALPGADPETMASAVAAERRLGRIAGLTEMTSVSALGQASVTLQFDLDKGVDPAAREVQAAINAAAGDLPPNLPSRPAYRKVNPSDAPILILALTSKVLPIGEVYDAGNTVLAQKLSQVPGVGQVFVGGAQPAIRIQADLEALPGAGLTLEDLRAAIASATSNQAKGALAGREVAWTVGANDQLLAAADWPGLIVAWRGGAPVRLRDVARVVPDVENVRFAAWADGERAVLLILRRQPGANIIETVDRVTGLLPELARAIPPSIDVTVVLDRSAAIRASIADVEWTLAASIALVVLVVLAFLGSARAALIPSVAVPLSIVGTFGVMYLAGFSLDNLSLMALTISTGFVVDDAIVVTENVARHVEEGRGALEAALLGAREIGFTIVSITVSLLAVFIPILLMQGIVGRLLREFSLTLAIAIALSALVSLTLTPMMCSRLLRAQPAEGAAPRGGRVGAAVGRAFAAVLRGYDRALGASLAHPAPVLLVTAGTVVLSGWLIAGMPKGLFPQQDTGLLLGFADAPQDISFPAMRERQLRLNQVVGSDPAVLHYVSFVGGGIGSAVNTGTVFVALRPLHERKVGAEAVIARLRRRLAQVPGVTLYLQAVQDLRVGGRLSRTQYQYTLQDADLGELNRAAPRLLAALRRLPELRDVASDQQDAGLQLTVTLDRDSMARVGLTPAAVDSTLYDAFGQRQVATLYTRLNQYHVILEALPAQQQHLGALERVYLGGADGTVPLPAVARLQPGRTALSVNHQGQFPSVTLSFNLAPGVSLGQAVAAIDRAALAAGMPGGLRGRYTGTAEVFQASLASEPYLIAAALLAVYLVLGVLYESYLHPLTILSTLPSAGMGALLALRLLGHELSIIALIGLVLLIGIVKKNAILMIDFAIEAERVRGLPPREAIREACRLRFRPILMTTLAALLGAVPLALSAGAGSELRRPLGVAIIGGLLASQLLTLLSTPVVYLVLDRLARRAAGARTGG